MSYTSGALAGALCREYHPMHWDVAYGNRNGPCGACRTHAARLSLLVVAGFDGLPKCEGWACQSCGADNFVPDGFIRAEHAHGCKAHDNDP